MQGNNSFPNINDILSDLKEEQIEEMREKMDLLEAIVGNLQQVTNKPLSNETDIESYKTQLKNSVEVFCAVLNDISINDEQYSMITEGREQFIQGIDNAQNADSLQQVNGEINHYLDQLLKSAQQVKQGCDYIQNGGNLSQGMQNKKQFKYDLQTLLNNPFGKALIAMASPVLLPLAVAGIALSIAGGAIGDAFKKVGLAIDSMAINSKINTSKAVIEACQTNMRSIEKELQNILGKPPQQELNQFLKSIKTEAQEIPKEKGITHKDNQQIINNKVQEVSNKMQVNDKSKPQVEKLLKSYAENNQRLEKHSKLLVTSSKESEDIKSKKDEIKNKEFHSNLQEGAQKIGQILEKAGLKKTKGDAISSNNDKGLNNSMKKDKER